MSPIQDPATFSPLLGNVLSEADRDKLDEQLNAPSVLLRYFDLNNPKFAVDLISRNEMKEHHFASISKLVVGMTVEDAIKSKAVELEDQITLVSADLPSGKLRNRDTFTVHELLQLMLMSSNGAASLALARHVAARVAGRDDPQQAHHWFSAQMHEKLTSSGLNHTRIDNIPGNSKDASRHHSNASDLANLTFNIAQNYPLVTQIAGGIETEMLFPSTIGLKTIRHTCADVMAHPKWNIFAKSGTMDTNSIVATIIMENRCFSVVSLGTPTRTRKRIRDVRILRRVVDRILQYPETLLP